MGAAVEINTGDIDPVHLKDKHVMLGNEDLGVLDGTERVVHFDIPAGRHVLYLKEGLTTSGAVGFLVQTGHCAQLTLKDVDAGMFAPFFGGWFALKRSGDVLEEDLLEDEEPGAREVPVDEVSSDA